MKNDIKIDVDLHKLKEETGYAYRQMSKWAKIPWTDFRRYMKNGKIPYKPAVKLEMMFTGLWDSEEDDFMVGRDGIPKEKDRDFFSK